MKLGIMQPYFCPYIGYFQLIKAVDKFIIYDNIKYTKKGWINRNKFLKNGKECLFSISIKKDSDSLDVRDREIAQNFNKTKILNQIKGAYQNATYFDQIFPFFEKVLLNNDHYLFKYIYDSVTEICKYLNIETEIIVSSTVNIDHTLKSQDKVIALCKKMNANIYINPIGGQELYDSQAFQNQNIDLKLIRSRLIPYKQFNNEFVPWLSILDVMMFNSVEEIGQLLKEYDLL